MSNELKDWMDSRRVRAVDVSDALHVSCDTVYQWRYKGIPGAYQERVRRYMDAHDATDNEGDAELLRALAEIHAISGQIISRRANTHQGS